MTEYQATFTAGSRTRTIQFKAAENTTREQLERIARDRLRNSTVLPTGNWDLVALARSVYLSDEDHDSPQRDRP